MKCKTLVVVLIIISISGCTNKQIALSEYNNILKENEYLKDKLNKKDNELQMTNKVIDELSSSMDDTKEEGTQNVVLEGNNFRVIKYSYLYGDVEIMPDTTIRSIPFSDGPIIRSGTTGKTVYVHEMVKNNNGETWVLIDYGNRDVTMSNALGYVPVSKLEKKYSKDKVNSKSLESIEGIRVNDYLDSAIEVFGDEYLLNVEFEGRYLLYCDMKQLDIENDDLNGDSDIVIEYDRNSRRIKCIVISTPNFHLESGYQVTDNIDDVINHYKNLYPMEKHTNSYSFKISEEEYLVIYYSMKSDDTPTVESIVIANYDYIHNL